MSDTPPRQEFGDAEADTQARQDFILGPPPRIAPLTPSDFSDEDVRIAGELIVRLRKVPGPAVTREDIDGFLATMMRHPKLYASHFDVGIKLLREGALAARDRELAVLRTGWLCQAPYEWGAHVTIGKSAGISSEEIARIKIGSAAPGWSKHEQAILRAVEELHVDAMISDETWAVLAERFDEKLLIEFVVMVGQYHSIAYFQNSLRVRLNPGSLGLVAR